MDANRIEHRTLKGNLILADLTWEKRDLTDPLDGSTESKWVLRVDATVDGMRAHLWGDEVVDGAEYVAVRTLHRADLYCVPKALWVEPKCPDPSYVRPSPPDISDLKGTHLYEQEMQRRAKMPRQV